MFRVEAKNAREPSAHAVRSPHESPASGPSPSGPSAMSFLRWAAQLCDRRLAPLGMPAEVANQVEDVRASTQVLRRAARVFFAAAAIFQDLADLAGLDELLDRLRLRAVPGLMGDGQLHMGAFAGGHHGVGLFHRAAEGFSM